MLTINSFARCILIILIISLASCDYSSYKNYTTAKYTNKVLIFGEMHGTKDIPEFFFEQIKAEFSHSKNVTVGLELPGRFNNLFIYFDSLKNLQAEQPFVKN